MQTDRLLSYRHARVLRCAAAVLACAASAAQAHTFCVGGALQLQSALTDSSDGGIHHGEVNLIELVRGNYLTGSATGNGPFHYFSASSSGSLTVSGGYNADCSAVIKNAALTILDGGGTTQVLSLRSAGPPTVVSFLTIQNGFSSNSSLSGGLGINELAGDHSSADANDLIIKNNYSVAAGAGLRMTVAGAGNHLSLQNNLITGNTSSIALSAGIVTCNGSGGASIYHNTIANNSGSSPAFGTLYYAGSAANPSIINNIIWGNANGGLDFRGSSPSLLLNDLQSYMGTAGTDFGNVSSDPLFVNAAGGNFHLSGASPLLGHDAFYSGGTDIEGHAIPTTGLVDLGAYEETIFADPL